MVAAVVAVRWGEFEELTGATVQSLKTA